MDFSLRIKVKITDRLTVSGESLSHTLAIYFGGQSPPMNIFYGRQ